MFQVLTAFRFLTAVTDYQKPEDHRETRFDLLDLAKLYPEMNISTYQWFDVTNFDDSKFVTSLMLQRFKNNSGSSHTRINTIQYQL